MVDGKTVKGKSIINELVVIGDWAKSCKTEAQLEKVEEFLRNKKWDIPSIDSKIVWFHLGIVHGIILTIKKRKAFYVSCE